MDRNAYFKTCSFTENFDGFSHLSDKIACRQHNQSAQSGYNSRRKCLQKIQIYLLSNKVKIFTSIIGSTYASVLPLPVGADTQTSR